MEPKLKHLSVLDGAFLHLETDEMPMHVGSVHVFDAPPGGADGWADAVRTHVRQRLHLAPVFTRRLAPVPLALANPAWLDDGVAELDHHVRQARLPRPGTPAQLDALVARLHAERLDRARPLWQFTAIDGLAGGKVAFYAKVHHAAIDGQAGIALARAMFDGTPDAEAPKAPRRNRARAAEPGRATMLGSTLEHQLRLVADTARRLPGMLRSAARLARGSAAAPADAGDTPGLLGRLRLAPPTPFNVPIDAGRAFAAVSLPFDEVRAIGKAHGASINDLVLWLVATALRRYLQRGGALPADALVAFVPVSARATGDASADNQVSATLADLPTAVDDPLERMRAVLAAGRAIKREAGAVKAFAPTSLPSIGSPWLLSGLLGLYERLALARRLRVVNVAVSNVPGPRVPLYLAGARMRSYHPVSIVVHGVALNITVQSYENQLGFGLLACRRAVPDLRRLAGDLQRAMAELRRLAPPGAP